VGTDETAVLRALAHPMRQDILDRLAAGSATSAMLARSLASNTGVLSYHLRELGKAGLIERDAARSRGREVYWRLVDDDVRFADPAVSAEPDLAHAAIDLILARTVKSVHAYARRTDLPVEWHDASLFSRSTLRLTAGQLSRMSAEYLEFLRRWARRTRRRSEAARPVRVMLFAFPDEPENRTGEPEAENQPEEM
jgi:DNA-binding transcriptional ArsR family regulator